MLRFISLLALYSTIGLGQNPGTILGRVVAEGTGQPLQASVMVAATGPGVRLNSAQTDQQGAFAIEAPVGRAVIVARADGYASEHVEVMVYPGRGNGNVAVSLKPAGAVSGRVVDAAGNGVAGARVWLQYRGEAQPWRSSDEAGGEDTDEWGNFRIPIVAQGKPFVLHADAEGWLLSSSQTVLLRGPALANVLLLLSRRGTTISGRVLDAGGQPIANAEVRLRSAPADHVFSAEQRQSIAFARAMNRSTRTLGDGSYAFGGVPAGRVVIAANARDLRSDKEVQVTSDSRVDLIIR